MNNTSPDFTEKTKKILAKMSSERCCLCEELTSKPNSQNDDYTSIGNAAHICGAREGKDLRFDGLMNDLQRKHHSNGIWLCGNCHNKIDNDENEYTIKKLHQIKLNHFERIKQGKYDLNTFKEIDFRNSEIKLLRQKIEDKEKIININDRLFDFELNNLKSQIEQISNERDKIWNDYLSILSNIEENKDFEYLFKIIFEDGNYTLALQYLDDENLRKEEISIVKKYLLKADIYKLQINENARLYYQKAFKINNSFEVGSFYIRYLTEINDFKELIKITNEILISEKRTDKILTLKGNLGNIYSKINPELAIHEFNSAIQIIDNSLINEKKSLLYKAGYLNYLAVAYKNKGDNKKALQICEEAFAIFLTGEVEGDTLEETFAEFCSMYNTIAQIYNSNLNYKEAQIYYELALKICNEQLKDNFQQKLTILINFSNLYINKRYSNVLKAKELINEAILILTNLSAKEPLKYFEMLIASYCKNAEIELFSNNTDLFLIEIEKAENLTNQLIRLNKKGFSNLSAEIANRKIIYYLSQDDIAQAKIEINNSILLFENSELNNYEFVNKYVATLLIKQNFIDNKDEKRDILMKAVKLLEPFANNYNYSILMSKQINEIIKKIA